LAIARTGAPWRDLPERYGSWSTVYDFFQLLVNSGVLVQIFADLNIDVDLQDMSIDSTSVCVHQYGCGAKKGAIRRKYDVLAEGLQPKYMASLMG